MNLLKADSLPCEHEAPALWASVRPLWSSPKFVYWGKVVTLQCSLVFPLKHIKAVLVIKRTYFLTFSRTKRDTSADVLTSAHFFMFLPCRSRGWNPIRPRYFNSVWRWAACANGPRVPDVCRGVGWKKKKQCFGLYWSVLRARCSSVFCSQPSCGGVNTIHVFILLSRSRLPHRVTWVHFAIISQFVSSFYVSGFTFK